MLEKIKNLAGHGSLKNLSNPLNVGLYIFLIIVLAIAWSGVRTLQNNYQLQKKISALKQQNNVLQLENDNTALENQYYKTDEYLDMSARQDLGLAAPGEKVMLIPKTVALKYVDQSLGSKTPAQPVASPSKFVRNFEAWRDFLLGRKLQS